MAFLLRRLVFYLAAFLAAATINFFLPRLMPGDPIQIMFAGAGSDLSLENLNALKLTFGFIDAPDRRAISRLSQKRLHRRSGPLDQVLSRCRSPSFWAAR